MQLVVYLRNLSLPQFPSELRLPRLIRFTAPFSIGLNIEKLMIEMV